MFAITTSLFLVILLYHCQEKFSLFRTNLNSFLFKKHILLFLIKPFSIHSRYGAIHSPVPFLGRSVAHQHQGLVLAN